jgi:hypothetical protein
MGIVLFIIVQVLAPIGNLIGTIWAICQFRSLREVSGYYKRVAVSKDQYLNVTMRYFFNSTMCKDIPNQKKYLFGHEDETISSALGKNLRRGTLTKFGYFWDRILHLIENNHTLLAIEEDEQTNKSI